VKDTRDSTTRVKTPYVIQDVPIGTRRPLPVVCMGAGYSGLLMTMVFRRLMQGKHAELVIYERNQDLDGTWLENRWVLFRWKMYASFSSFLTYFRNRYPGCQCDIPAHNYAFSFEPNPKWPNYTPRRIRSTPT
jgi:cation diffusion facilitator CzcD-associated flavoprotein CzcO